MTEIKTKKLTTAQRVRQIEEDIEEIRQVVSPLISEHQQLQQSLVDIVKEFDGRMIAMSFRPKTSYPPRWKMEKIHEGLRLPPSLY